jgi:short chain dehydrogenase
VQARLPRLRSRILHRRNFSRPVLARNQRVQAFLRGISGRNLGIGILLLLLDKDRLPDCMLPPRQSGGKFYERETNFDYGAGSGFGERAAIGLAQNGHHIIAGVQIWPQVTSLRQKVRSLGLNNLRVEKLDLLHPYDVDHALKWDIDILFSNAGIGENGPACEIPVDLVRRTFETNVFAPLNSPKSLAASGSTRNGPVKWCLLIRLRG